MRKILAGATYLTVILCTGAAATLYQGEIARGGTDGVQVTAPMPAVLLQAPPARRAVQAATTPAPVRQSAPSARQDWLVAGVAAPWPVATDVKDPAFTTYMEDMITLTKGAEIADMASVCYMRSATWYKQVLAVIQNAMDVATTGFVRIARDKDHAERYSKTVWEWAGNRAQPPQHVATPALCQEFRASGQLKALEQWIAY